jgi:hypothetical protein
VVCQRADVSGQLQLQGNTSRPFEWVRCRGRASFLAAFMDFPFPQATLTAGKGAAYR